MKSVLHIITGLGDGGAEAVLYRLCTHDRNSRHHVISLTDHGKYGPLLQAAGIPAICLNMPRGKVRAKGLWHLWRAIRRSRPDVVQTWMYHADLLGGIASRLAGIRNVVWGIHHTTLDPAQSPRSTILVAKACAWLSRRVPRRILCCAERSREVHVGLGYDATRMVVVPNGYDLSVFQPNRTAGAAVRTELGIGPSIPLIGFVARFDPLKDHANLLQAMAVLKARDVTPVCLLVGSGIDAENTVLCAAIAELGLADQIRLLGRRSDIPAVMNALDLHVLSSASEAFPNVLAEAMACGTPCVSTDVGDAAAILGRTGRIVPPRDPEALAAAIAEMLELRNSPNWQQSRAATRQHVADNFTLDRMVESYRQVWFTSTSASTQDDRTE